MKYDITKEDVDVMARDMRTNRTLKHLKNASFYKFSVGDILVREDLYTTNENTEVWKVKLADCGLPYKYVYAFENEVNVGYIRRLSINGRKFVEAPICILEFDPERTRFSLDPEYADHLLLSPDQSDFDVKSRYDEIKSKRESVHRKNKKMRLKIENTVDAVNWLSTLKTGTQFWYGYNIGNIEKNPLYVEEIRMLEEQDRSYFFYSRSPGGARSRMYMSGIVGGNIFLNKPLFIDEII